jgi:outer membrane protein TolC
LLPLALAATLVAAQDAAMEEPLSLDSVSTLAVRRSAEVVRLRRDVDAALDDLGWGAYRDDIALVVNGSARGTSPDDVAAHADASLDVSVELLPQLTLSGNVTARVDEPEPPKDTDPLSGSVSVTLRPFADAKGRDRDELALEYAELNLASGSRSVAYRAVSQLLSLVEAQTATPLLESELELARDRLTAVRALAERDRATADEVDAARDAVRKADQTLRRHELAVRRGLDELAQTIGVTSERIRVPGWEALGIERRAAAAASAAEAIEPDELVAAAPDVVRAELDVRRARIERDATAAFSPEISAGAGVSLPGPSYSLSLGLTVRPSDWDGRKRAHAEEDVGFARDAVRDARRIARYAIESALLELDISVQELDAARNDLAIAEQDMVEARFRFDRGDVTPLELRQAELSLARSRQNVETARASVVRTWLGVDLAQF